ncbi:hypothetical protein CH373_09275 [Leptospira perolatii]|uniref:Adenylate-forming protein n=1 Tax=Leptospira perolatii TaxID=2023191 RepID=A0A2M9ZNU0_9LEPT|nr:phenylacetate--CoA ligase family protein [Leptospira perolatii]PJZ69678.1 hypothetical protein CH360_10420 [Leptospira perolatii]PJZ73665.1 hypothetical protein CH373_09275 [Leptospira perolatii]
MNFLMMMDLLRRRRTLRSRESWSREKLDQYRAAGLRELREFATSKSPFYRKLHSGLTEKPLEELPVITKKDMMENFDDFVTDRNVKLSEVESYLSDLKSDSKFLNKYWVSTTSGSTGKRGIILSDYNEWMNVIASYSRANEWSGIRVDLFHPMRMAVVSSTAPWHQSARVGMTVKSPWVPSIRLSAAEPLSEIVAGLNQFQPQSLIAYSSMVRILAVEQLEKRLSIHPKAVVSSSEVLTEETRKLATKAWGIAPFNVYPATETAGLGCECKLHTGLHMFEDLVITEVVDENNRPVEPGTLGAKVLVSVLFSRTQPLIRYEMSDRICVSEKMCDCGRPFRLISNIEGRMEDIFSIPGKSGILRIHPVLFHKVLDKIPAGAWQLRQERDSMRVLVASPASNFNVDLIREELRSALMQVGAIIPTISIEIVESIPKTIAGKSPILVPYKEVAAKRL